MFKSCEFYVVSDDMLCCFSSVRELNIGLLIDVYAQSLFDGVQTGLARLQRERDFLDDLHAFFHCDGAQIYVWEQEGNYCSALRLEPYRDGFLISCLETDPGQRRAGYGSLLLSSVIKKVDKPVYVHIEKRNRASIALHTRCGFVQISDHAVYVDGSVYQSSCTMRFDP